MSEDVFGMSPLKTEKLLKAKRYYEKVVIEGKDKTEAAAAAGVGQSADAIRSLESSPEFKFLLDTLAETAKNELKPAIIATQTQALQAYRNLILQGDELIRHAKTNADRLAAQKNQRANLDMDFADRALGWLNDGKMGESVDDALDGVILQ